MIGDNYNKNLLPYRLCAGVMLLNKDRLVFVGQRIDQVSEAWQMPQGGIDNGENPRDAAMRELQEEIGTDKFEIMAESKGWYNYDLPDDLIGMVWGGRYRGQRQKWFVANFTGKDSDINLNTPHPEFFAWKWSEPRELPNLIVPFKRQLYIEIMEEFHSFIS